MSCKKKALAALIGSIFVVSATQAMAEYVRVEAAGSVQETADRLVAAVEGAGATVFARVPHSKGAMSVDMELQDAELVIFGNPKLGSHMFTSNQTAGIDLPMKALAYRKHNPRIS